MVLDWGCFYGYRVYRGNSLSTRACNTLCVKAIAMTIKLDNYRALSWNTLYAGKHWATRSRLVEEAHMLVGYVIMAMKPKLFSRPVDITITAVQKGRIIDSDNICAKILIDALKGKIIVDDTPTYVRRVTTESKKGKEDMVIMEITETKGV